MPPDALEFRLPSGRLHAERSGPPDGPVVLCVPGLSANVRGFDRIAGRLAAQGNQVVVLDLRGRGRSEVTPPGTYGLEAHARDLLAVADTLGTEDLDLVGWSLGALVGIALAPLAPERVRRLVLIDHLAGIDPGPAEAIRAGLARLDAVVPDRESYVETMRARAPIARWEPLWDAYFAYELAPREDGTWSPSTDRSACEEDMERVPTPERLRAAWEAIAMPALLVRCTTELAGGLIVPEAELAAFRAAVPDARVVEVDANHYDVMTDERAIAATAAHLAPTGVA